MKFLSYLCIVISFENNKTYNMAKVVRYCKLEEEHCGENCFDVSRPNVMSNPYTHIKSKKTLAKYVVGSREEAVQLYELYFNEMLKLNKQFQDEWDRMYEAYKKYDTIYIGCYCHKGDLCHGDVIAKKLKQRAIKEAIDKIKEKRNKTNEVS